MYTLENIKLNKILLFLILLTLLSSTLFGLDKLIDGSVKYKEKNGKYTLYHLNTQKIKSKYNHFRLATKNEVNAWNTDVMPNGTGLPLFDEKKGKRIFDKNGKPVIAKGSAEWGAELYDEHCAMCHGEFGTGGIGYPPLSIGEASTKSLKNQLLNPADKEPNPQGPRKVIGTYWPYATTLFWYIKESMPFTNPKSLSNSETYGLTAYLLMINGVQINGEDIEDDFVLSKKNFLDIKMPNEKGFYPDVNTKDPKKALENIRVFLNNPKNYGTGTRCMKNCIKGKVPILRIKHELNDFEPPASTKRSWKEKISAKNKVDTNILNTYETYCAACHENKAIGAPLFGDKTAWQNVLKKGMNKVYTNAIIGINAMPPKGGAMQLSDEEFKKVVDYIVNSSK